jgi:hypothetical protein
LFALFGLIFFGDDLFNDVVFVYFHLVDECAETGVVDLSLFGEVVGHDGEAVLVDFHEDVDAAFADGEDGDVG